MTPLEQQRPLDVLILAAGLGTRMKSQKAKVLHELGGHPLIAHVTRKAHALDHEKIYVVVGHQAADVEAAVRRELGSDADRAAFVIQKQQRGTGDAVMSAREALKDSNSTLLVLSGDVPLVRVETLQKFVDFHRANGAACSILSVKLENPTGYGRMVRDATEGFARIVEQKDATPEERLIREINSGIYCFETTKLFSALNEIKPANQQGEYYLTDVPAILAAGGERIAIYLHQDAREVSGINTRADLAEFENLLRRGTIRGLMMEGVTFIDPSHAYVSAEAQIGHDCVIYPDVLIEGEHGRRRRMCDPVRKPNYKFKDRHQRSHQRPLCNRGFGDRLKLHSRPVCPLAHEYPIGRGFGDWQFCRSQKVASRTGFKVDASYVSGRCDHW